MAQGASKDASRPSQTQPGSTDSLPSSSGLHGWKPPPTRDVDSLKYSRLHNKSYYDLQCALCHGKNHDKEKEYILASDARAQQENAPRGTLVRDSDGNRDRAEFLNGEMLPLTCQPLWRHHPLTLKTAETFIFRVGEVDKGAVRSVYNQHDPSKFDVMVHDKRMGLSKKGIGQFRWAPYVPAEDKKPELLASREVAEETSIRADSKSGQGRTGEGAAKDKSWAEVVAEKKSA